MRALTLREVDWPDTPFVLDEALVLVGRRGSEAHGMYVPPTDPDAIDDRDLMGIAVPPRPYYLGMLQWEGADSFKGPWDVVLYEWRKFVRLLCKQNPNVLAMLWLEPEDYLFVSPPARRLLDERRLFVSRTAAFESFCGYARGQAAKMERGAFKGYMGAKRKALVERYGYDTKNAAHLIRLLRMGREFLSTGALRVRRTDDRDELLAIKRGEWSLEAVRMEAARLFDDCRSAYEASTLPDALDMERIESLAQCVVEEHLGLPLEF